MASSLIRTPLLAVGRRVIPGCALRLNLVDNPAAGFYCSAVTDVSSWDEALGNAIVNPAVAGLFDQHNHLFSRAGQRESSKGGANGADRTPDN
jgi:hypothetical protein